MSEKKQEGSAKMQVLGQFIKDLSFENFAARDSKQGTGTPNIDVKINLDASKRSQKDQYNSSIKITVESKESNTEENIFLLELDYGGIFKIENIPDDGLILDIGKKSIAIIDKEISKTKEVLWCGPLGLFEKSPFHVGTASVAKTLSKMTKNGKIISVAGGGDTVAAISQSNYVNDFTYISTAGGAFLEMIAGKKLPGIEVLRK